jgi:hypothetical protein
LLLLLLLLLHILIFATLTSKLNIDTFHTFDTLIEILRI